MGDLKIKIRALVSQYGYQAVKMALDAERGHGRSKYFEYREQYVWIIIELTRREMKFETLSSCLSLISKAGGIPEPRFRDGVYERGVIKPEGTLRRLYYVAERHFKNDQSEAQSAQSAVDNFAELYRRSNMPYNPWLKKWLSELYHNPPQSWS